MTDHVHPTHDELVLHYYAEPTAVAAQVNAHLASCAACRAELDHLRHTLALVDESAEGEPPPGYEAVLWARLQDALITPPWWRRWLHDGPVRWAMAGTLAAVLLGAFLSGWLARDVTAPSPTAAPAFARADTATVPRRVLVAAVSDHLERVQRVLAEVLNAAPNPDDAAGERDRAGELVAMNRLFRQSADLAGDTEMDQALEQLERVLLEIANTPDAMPEADRAALRARIERDGVLFRVRVLSEELRARQQADPAEDTKGRSS